MEKLLKFGGVNSASSPWAACNIFIKKKDGKLRITSNFGDLHALTVTDRYPMEYLRVTLDWMATNSFLLTFDLKEGFF